MTRTFTRITGPVCMFCGRESAVEVTATEAAALASGSPVHVALAGHSRPEREMLISGTHPRCWLNAFGPRAAQDD